MSMDLPGPASEDDTVEVLLAGSDPEYLQQVADKVYQDDINVHSVATTDPESAIARIEEGGVDCLIATYNPSANEGLPILDFLRETNLEVPVILLPSGPTTVVVSENLVVDVASVFSRDEALNGSGFGPGVVVEAVEQRRATAAAKRRRGVENAIHTVARELSRAEAREDVDASLVEGMADSREIDSAWMTSVEDDEVSVEAAAGDEEIPMPESDDATGEAVKRALAVEQPQVTTRDGTSYAAVPVTPENDEAGVLTLASRDRFAFSDDETRVLADVGATARRAADDVAFRAAAEDLDGRDTFETMLERLSVPVVAYGSAGWVVGANDAFAALDDRERFEVVGEPVWDVLPAPRLETFEDYWASFSPGETRTQLVEFDGLATPRQLVTTRVAVDEEEFNVTLAVEPVEEGADPWFADVLAYEFRHWLAIAEEALEDRDDPEEEEAVLDEVVTRMQDAMASEVESARAGAEAGAPPEETIPVGEDGAAADAEPVASADEPAVDTSGGIFEAGSAEDLAADVPEPEVDAESPSEPSPTAERAEATSELSQEPQPVGEVARDAWMTVVGDFGEYEIHGGRRIYADRTLLHRLFAHLFRTLLSYGKASAIDVGIDDDGFFIEDDGSGVPHVDRDYVEAATMTDARSGAGLRVARRLAERHGWELVVMPNDKGGSRFDISGVVQADE